MARPKKQPPSTIDLTAHHEDARIFVSDELKHGTPAEMRQNLGLMAAMLESKNGLREPYRSWLIDALRQMALDGDANEALGLKRTGPSPSEVKATKALADSLERQGMSQADAFDFIARYDSHREIVRQPKLKQEGDAGDALLQHIRRWHKRIFGSIPKTK